MILLTVEIVPLDLDPYCALPPGDQLAWEDRDGELNKAMLYLMNSKKKQTKKDLRPAYSQGNMTAYLF